LSQRKERESSSTIRKLFEGPKGSNMVTLQAMASQLIREGRFADAEQLIGPVRDSIDAPFMGKSRRS